MSDYHQHRNHHRDHHSGQKCKCCREAYRVPVVYSQQYTVKFCGLQNFHTVEVSKGQRIMELLTKMGFLREDKIYKPEELTEEELLEVHTEEYINSLKYSPNAAKIAQIPLLLFVPNSMVQRGYLRPLRFQAAGSILAAKLALQEGWAINLGGGFHNCCSYEGGLFCPYADITLLIKRVMAAENTVKKVMIVDLDAHQGNGHERDFLHEPNVFILDIYNSCIYPRDNEAKAAINCAVELLPRTEDNLYLSKLKNALEDSLEKFKPDFIVYNAGIDILVGDPLGLLSVTPKGVIERDEFVFTSAMMRKIPIVMLLSGGFLKSSAQVLSDSIMNLRHKRILPRNH